MLRAGKVIVIVSIFLSALNSFSLSGKIVDNINDSALASVSRVITPVFKPIGVHEDNWQATVGLFTGAMAKGSRGRDAEHPLHRRRYPERRVQSADV